MKPEVKDGEVWYGDVVMPSYQGLHGSTHQVIKTWRVGGVLPDGRVFELRIYPGAVFDGASVPRFLWRLCGHPLEVPRVAAGLGHDWLYWAHVCDRATADAIYKALLVAVGEGAVRVTVEYATLRLCGGSAWKSHGENDQKFARARGMLFIDGVQMKGEAA